MLQGLNFFYHFIKDLNRMQIRFQAWHYFEEEFVVFSPPKTNWYDNKSDWLTDEGCGDRMTYTYIDKLLSF